MANQLEQKQIRSSRILERRLIDTKGGNSILQSQRQRGEELHCSAQLSEGQRENPDEEEIIGTRWLLKWKHSPSHKD